MFKLSYVQGQCFKRKILKKIGLGRNESSCHKSMKKLKYLLNKSFTFI